MDRTQGASKENHGVIVLQHAESENLGTIEDVLKTGGVTFDYVRAFEGQPIPYAVGESSGLIIMGGPMGVYEDRFPFLRREMKLIEAFLEAHRPILGMCQCRESSCIRNQSNAMIRKDSNLVLAPVHE